MESTGTVKKWYKKWWGITILVLGGIWLIGLISEASGTADSKQSVNQEPTSQTTAWTPRETSPPTTAWTPPPTTAISNKRTAFLTVTALVPAFEDAGATEDEIWNQLGIVCDGFRGGLDYLEIGRILVQAAESAGISPFEYREAGAVVGAATTLVCSEYDGWQDN